MKESNYNFYLRDHTGMVIYNAKSDEVIALVPQLAELYEQRKETPETIRDVHPELFAYLVEKGVFIEEDIDEVEAYIKAREEKESKGEEFTITVNPTLACNMKCWYCYENHQNMPAMNDKVKQSVLALIEKLIEDERLKKLNVSFFGGEPLLFFDKIVAEIMDRADSLCKEKGAALSFHFTTNAFLLTEKVLERMKGRDVSFQITLDGNENVHNTVRMTKTDQLTYRVIVEHICQATRMGFPVGVRFNYTAKSLPSFIDVLSDFQDVSSEQKSRLNFTFQRVWQDNEGDPEQIERQVGEIEQAFEKAGLIVNASNDYAVPYCYADKKNTAVINYNGDLYKCTARDFLPKNKEGVLTADGNLKWNERNKRRMAIRHGIDFCRRCRIYPICHGGCSQMKLESSIIDSCPKGYDAEKIEEIMKGRAMFILKKHNKQAAE